MNLRSLVCASLLLSGTALRAAAPAVFEVKSYGAKADGTTLDTAAIQAAIDAASQAGGGTVHFSGGTYRTVTLTLKSNVTLDLDADALIQASPVSGDWPPLNPQPVIKARSVSHIRVQGKGAIDGAGMTYYDANGNFLPGNRPQTILRFSNCQDASVSGITFRNSVRWTLVFEQCDHLTVDGIVIRNREYAFSRETDGVDIIGGRNVLVENGDIQTGDDALCLKLQGDPFQQPPRPTHDVTFRHCTLATSCNATKIGTGTANEAYHVLFTDITVNKLPHTQPSPAHRAAGRSCIAAIAVESNDGGDIHDITFENYTVNDCDTPIFMEVQNRQDKFLPHSFGKVRRITVSDFICRHSARASQINVQPGGRLQEITLHNLTIHNFGTSPGAASPPCLTGKYPDANHYGEMPACGLFARCVDGLALTGTIDFHDDGASGRPATKFEDVTLAPSSSN